MKNMPRTTKQMLEHFSECLENCLACYRVCTETMSHGWQLGGHYAEAAHLRLLADCADICQTSANFLMRGSERHSSVCAVCAEVCLRCAEQCERFADDEWMKVCAAACRRCAESCQLMTAMQASTARA
jgi:hypothetical protein